MVGVEDGPVGFLPADQGLGTDDGQVSQRKLGLEVELELVVLHGPDEAVHQLVGQGLALGRFLVVIEFVSGQSWPCRWRRRR